MQPTGLNALRQYDIAKTALKPDVKTNGPGSETKPSRVGEEVEKFAKVFENVDKVTNELSMGTADAHSVVEALANAEMALETAVTIRNRVVEAYQEILRMPV